jgi:formylglycine-generating enzyme required for sulfatase activity
MEPRVLRSARVFIPVVAAWILAAPSSPPAPSLEELLTRAGAYIVRFNADFANVVSEERYAQWTSGRQTMIRVGRGAITSTSGPDRRELVSDFLLVKLPGVDAWVSFRDTFEVDGKPVRERQDRLSALMLHPTEDAFAQAGRILEESTRYNIGNVTRTVNMPLLALGFLDTASQSHFRYSLGHEDTALGTGIWIVNFEERSHPTFIRNPVAGRDLIATGRYWIEAATGSVLKTELVIHDDSVRALLATSFRPDDRFQLNVPFEMVEEYTLQDRSRVSGRATYGRFRTFDATATETIATGPARWMTEPVTGMILVELTPGQFAMGSPPSEAGREADERPHDVTLTTPFYLGRFEVTQHEWKTIMGTAPSRSIACGPRCPVENVNFDDVQKFLTKLNARSAADIRFRLPTEAEWEYACRAGTAAPFVWGATISATQGNYGGSQPAPVGSFEPNPWGLSDLHGNVAEWTADWYAPYRDGLVVDPRGAASGDARVARGGGWDTGMSAARCAARNHHPPAYRGSGLGFRIAADIVSRP